MEAKPGQSSLRRGRVSIEGQIYFITAVVRDREPVFLDFGVACCACSRFVDSQLIGQAEMLAWVLMPDHAHWLLQLKTGGELDAIVGRLKAVSSRAVNRLLGREGALWQPGYHDRALRRDEDLITAARYLVANPIRAQLATKLGDYPYWNATWL